MKQIIVMMHLVIFILYLIVTPMIILCHIKGKSELEGSLKLFILVISIISITLAIL